MRTATGVCTLCTCSTVHFAWDACSYVHNHESTAGGHTNTRRSAAFPPRHHRGTCTQRSKSRMCIVHVITFPRNSITFAWGACQGPGLVSQHSRAQHKDDSASRKRCLYPPCALQSIGRWHVHPDPQNGVHDNSHVLTIGTVVNDCAGSRSHAFRGDRTIAHRHCERATCIAHSTLAR